MIARVTNTSELCPSNRIVSASANYPGVIPTMFQLLAKKCFVVSSGLHLPTNITSTYCFRRLVLDVKAAGATDEMTASLEADWVHVNQLDISMNNKDPIGVQLPGDQQFGNNSEFNEQSSSLSFFS
ncbi:hypothetical protein FRC07_012210 [Ceratobasidium sp. 392]|nr:hypothetical protein FRC07_012210 [Ceratobasidium sp. 392]